MLFPDDKVAAKALNGDYKRLDVSYKDTSDRFKFTSRSDYSKQFAHIYASRLSEMRDLLTLSVEKKWGKKYPLKRMADLREDNPETCVLIGTLLKHQSLRPSILRDISEETQLAPQPVRENFVDDADKLILEDELQRIRLLGKMDVHTMVTGIVCAILGYEEGDGKFMVEDYIFYESGPQKPLKDLTVSPLLVLISGLDMSSQKDFSMSLELFQQWLYGNLEGFGQTKDIEAANVVRVVVAGNSVRTTFEKRQRSNLTAQPESFETLRAVKSLDDTISGWMKSVHVDLMPGEFDPSNFMLPQQPMHQCMFPQCSVSKAFYGVTNPYEFQIEDRNILGTSGQNIENVAKYSKIADPMELLKSILRWSHVAPTSPDTLPCYPYYEKDPFVISSCPHVMFVGNTAEYKTDLHKGPDGQKTRLVCIPSFSKTQSIAVVNLRTLDCRQLSFRVNGFEDIEE